MEKFQIAKYGMMQVTALVYAILTSGAAVKFSKGYAEMGLPMPKLYYWALFLRDYGAWFMIGIISWILTVSYLSSPFAKQEFDADNLALTGLVLTGIVVIGGSIIAFGLLGALFSTTY